MRRLLMRCCDFTSGWTGSLMNVRQSVRVWERLGLDRGRPRAIGIE